MNIYPFRSAFFGRLRAGCNQARCIQCINEALVNTKRNKQALIKKPAFTGTCVISCGLAAPAAPPCTPREKLNFVYLLLVVLRESLSALQERLLHCSVRRMKYALCFFAPWLSLREDMAFGSLWQMPL
jgi:hypothetical protein